MLPVQSLTCYLTWAARDWRDSNSLPWKNVLWIALIHFGTVNIIPMAVPKQQQQHQQNGERLEQCHRCVHITCTVNINWLVCCLQSNPLFFTTSQLPWAWPSGSSPSRLHRLPLVSLTAKVHHHLQLWQGLRVQKCLQMDMCGQKCKVMYVTVA